MNTPHKFTGLPYDPDDPWAPIYKSPWETYLDEQEFYCELSARREGGEATRTQGNPPPAENGSQS